MRLMKKPADSAPTSERPVRILAVSDEESKFIWEHFDPEVFRGIDLILSCGDLKASYLSYLVTMIPAPLFYVYGNHDGGYDRDPPLGCECVDGRVAEFRGLRIAGLGGCKGGDPNNPYQFTEQQMEKRVRKLESSLRRGKGPDIFLSHAPTAGLGDLGGMHEGFQCFRGLYEKYPPRLHLYGHIHYTGGPTMKAGSFEVGSTKVVNCAGYRILEI